VDGTVGPFLTWVLFHAQDLKFRVAVGSLANDGQYYLDFLFLDQSVYPMSPAFSIRSEKLRENLSYLRVVVFF